MKAKRFIDLCIGECIIQSLLYKRVKEVTMKRGWIILIVLSLIAMPMIASAQSMNFAVKLSGLDFQSAQFGLPMGSLQPFIGIDYFSLSASGETEAAQGM
ncbi:MAG: hypothetical protein ABIL68_14310 [bacterium]